jgi:hypothetical protein
MTTEHEVGLNVQVTVVVKDQTAITRCTENHDDQGVPQEDVRGGTGWRNSYYPLDTPEKVLHHFAYNAVVNGLSRGDQLDGWADLERDGVTMSVDDVQLDWVQP